MEDFLTCWVGLRLSDTALELVLEAVLKTKNDHYVLALLAQHELSASMLDVIDPRAASSAVNLAVQDARARSTRADVAARFARHLAGTDSRSLVKVLARGTHLSPLAVAAVWGRPGSGHLSARVELLRLGSFDDTSLPAAWERDVLDGLDTEGARKVVARIGARNPERAMRMARSLGSPALVREAVLSARTRRSAAEEEALDVIEDLLDGDDPELSELVGVLTRLVKRDASPVGTRAFDLALEVVKRIGPTKLGRAVNQHLLAPGDEPSSSWVRARVGSDQFTPYAVLAADRLGPSDPLWGATHKWLTPLQARTRLGKDKGTRLEDVIAGKDAEWLAELARCWDEVVDEKSSHRGGRSSTGLTFGSPERLSQAYLDLIGLLDEAALLELGREQLKAARRSSRAEAFLAHSPALVAELPAPEVLKPNWGAHQALVDLLEERLGCERASWEAFVKLLPEWGATVGELIDVAGEV
jgi:hypothetical protein